jgi:hypothetical protein
MAHDISSMMKPFATSIYAKAQALRTPDLADAHADKPYKRLPPSRRPGPALPGVDVIAASAHLAPRQFRAADISVRVNGEPAAVLTADALRQEAADEASSARRSARIAAAFRGLSASQAGTQRTTTTVTSPRGTATITSTTEDPAATRAATQDNLRTRDAQIAAANAVESGAVARIAEGAIARTTLRPGQSLTGFIVIESEELGDPFNDLCKLELRAAFGPDVHALVFEQKNQE